MHAVEERASRVLERVPAWLWDGERLPVPVEDIADSVFGLLVRDIDDLGTAPGAPALAPEQELSGLLLAARGEIWVNAREARTWPTRRRFTIGHELGHWELHLDGQTTLFCRSTTVDEDQRRTVPDLEEEASRFAAALSCRSGSCSASTRASTATSTQCARPSAQVASRSRRLADLFGAG